MRIPTRQRSGRRQRRHAPAPAAMALAIAGAVAAAAWPAAAEPLEVVASFSIIADFARQVGGDRISLTTLVGPGSDVHAYQPRPADAAALAAADVVLVNGLGFEGFLGRLAGAGATGRRVVELSAGIEPITAGETGHREAEDGHDRHAGSPDPHAFQSAANARLYVDNAAGAFCAADPQGCEAYRANAAAYGEKLAALDGEIRAAIASIPPERRAVITSHDAFGYFEQAYGLRFLAPEGISTDSEPSARDIAALIGQVRRESASAIFVETMSDRRLMEQIASETGLEIGGELHSDTLSGPDGPAATYIEMMRSNVRAIREAILGQ